MVQMHFSSAVWFIARDPPWTLLGCLTLPIPLVGWEGVSPSHPPSLCT